ncbi:hypothetical protein D9619_010041 [Psilocybe cf. subviscida]|uniref:Uncharacterized protein n=1 Tax=Psilocybe cf. subviscida TaxID=2480587 RepID=A0A8H5BLB9_9AGAR|nr:hypothetical protein D9619_010041 [Psilocybe cf. subviscida]
MFAHITAHLLRLDFGTAPLSGSPTQFSPRLPTPKVIQLDPPRPSPTGPRSQTPTPISTHPTTTAMTAVTVCSQLIAFAPAVPFLKASVLSV